MSGKYPYDHKSRVEGEGATVLKQCFDLASELMFVYEPFGQAASSYETGAPEYTALGIRTFLSTPSNIQMMEDIGKNTLESLKTLASVEEFRLVHIKKYGKAPNEGHHMTDDWIRIKKELEQTDKRTFIVVMKSAHKYVDELMLKYAEEYNKDNVIVIQIDSNVLLSIKLATKNDKTEVHKKVEINKTAKDQIECIDILCGALDDWFIKHPELIILNVTFENLLANTEWIQHWNRAFQVFQARLQGKLMKRMNSEEEEETK